MSIMGSLDLLLESNSYNLDGYINEGNIGSEYLEESMLPLEEEWCKIDLAIAKVTCDLYQEAATAKFLNKIGEVTDLSESVEKLEALSEGVMKDTVRKVVEFFKKFYRKIREFLAKFITFLDRFVMKDKNFAKKYRKLLVGKDDSKFEFTAYNLKKFKDLSKLTQNDVPEPSSSDTADKATKVLGLGSSAKKEDVDKVKKEKDKYMNKVRGLFILGKETEVESGEERKTLNKEYWGDEDGPEKDEFKGFGSFISVSKALDIIESGDKSISNLKKIDNKTQKLLNDTIKKIENDAKEAMKDLDSNNDDYKIKEGVYNLNVAALKTAGSAYSKVISFQIDSIKLFKSETRRVLSAFARHNPLKESADATDLDDEDLDIDKDKEGLEESSLNRLLGKYL